MAALHLHPVPSVVYHGTNFEFERFESKHLGTSCKNPTTDFGFFFTDSIDDAWSWAQRASDYGRAPDSPRLIEATLNIDRLVSISPEKFHFYLQRAKTSTIQRDKRIWMEDGFEGLTVMRGGGVRWYAPFDASKIEMIGVVDRPIERMRA